MNLLLDCAPEFVEINGVEYEIDADFRNCIKFEQLMFDPDISDNLRGTLALRLFYPNIPPDTAAAFEKIIWLYSCGEKAKQGISGGKSGKKVYSYEEDGGYIFAAFLADYKIDLEAVEHLHWWKFRAMFDSLRSENMICKIMEYRTADISKMKDEQKQFYQDMKKLYALPAPRDETEKLDEINDVLMNDGNVSKVLNKLQGR